MELIIGICRQTITPSVQKMSVNFWLITLAWLFCFVVLCSFCLLFWFYSFYLTINEIVDCLLSSPPPPHYAVYWEEPREFSYHQNALWPHELWMEIEGMIILSSVIQTLEFSFSWWTEPNLKYKGNKDISQNCLRTYRDGYEGISLELVERKWGLWGRLCWSFANERHSSSGSNSINKWTSIRQLQQNPWTE